MKRALLILLLSLTAMQAESLGPARERLVAYRAELDRFRSEFGGARDLPDEPFFLFGMGLRPKLFYRAGNLVRAPGGETVRRWDVAEEIILPADYTVILRTRAGDAVRLSEDERGVWIEEAGRRARLPGTEAALKLPRFKRHRFPQVLRVLHHELLVNVLTNGPVLMAILEVIGQHPIQVSRMEHDHGVQALASNGADQPLHERIARVTGRRRPFAPAPERWLALRMAHRKCGPDPAAGSGADGSRERPR